MSAVADFRLVETSRLNELSSKAEIKIKKNFFSKKVIAGYWEFLYANSKKFKDFNSSGYVFAVTYLPTYWNSLLRKKE
jgi:hypothetical protein